MIKEEYNKKLYIKCSGYSSIEVEGGNSKISSFIKLKNACSDEISLQYTAYLDISNYRVATPIVFKLYKRYKDFPNFLQVGNSYLAYPGISFSSLKFTICDKDIINKDVEYFVEIKNNSTFVEDIVKVSEVYLAVIFESNLEERRND